MGRRIIAWVLLVGFLLLIVNLSYFQWQSTYFVALYMGIVVFYILTSGKNKYSERNRENNIDNKNLNENGLEETKMLDESDVEEVKDEKSSEKKEEGI